MSGFWCSVSWSRGCVDLEWDMTKEVSQLSEFSGRSFSTEEVEPTQLGMTEKFVWFGIR